MSSFGWKIVDHLGLYGGTSWKKAVFPASLIPLLTLEFLGFEKRGLPFTAFLVIPLCVILIFLLSLESIAVPLSLISASLRQRLNLMRRLDSQLDEAIVQAEAASVNMDEKEVRSVARMFYSDFENKRPFPRLLSIMMQKILGNFVLAILCFALITMSVLSLSLYYDQGNPYRHSCFLGSYPKAVVHFFYYHSVLFQSLGDGDHAPQTLVTQAIATGEVFVAFMFTLLIFASVLSAALYVEGELTPKKLSKELYCRLLSLSAAGSDLPQAEG